MRIPRSTYRLQVNADFTLDKVQGIIAYLHELGISDLYISPIYEARAGSTHGYDVVRPDRINPEIGTIEQLRAIAAEARAHDMGILLDIVPNHMAASETNGWWRDVLENGRASGFADFFDVDWQADPPGTGRLLLPVLGQPLDAAIAAGEVTAGVKDGLPVLRYFDRDFPLDPATYALFFECIGAGDDALRAVFELVPDREDVHRRGERAQRAENAKRAVRDWFAHHGEPREFALQPQALRRLHDAQPYSLWYWVRGTRRINYRRFFDISDLAGLRVEDEAVFDAVHALTLPLINEGIVTGLRIDHIDGLRDPEAYLARLRRRSGHAFVVVEKILIGNEELPRTWDTEGTTGYDFIGALTGVFLDPAGSRRIRDWYEGSFGAAPFEAMLAEKKRLVIDVLFDGEARDLAAAFVALAARMGVTVQAPAAQEAISTLTAALPVYRTYITERGIPEESRAYIQAARSKIAAAPEALNLLIRMLLLDVPQEHRPAVVDFVMRWQQFTGPVMAKGLEDTTFYNYNALVSVCEVGAYPPVMPVSVDDFHAFLQRRGKAWPHTMNASSTHDTKRSEDVRARLNVLSEIPDEWIALVESCSQEFDDLRQVVHGEPVPGRNEQLLLYQTLIGAWPLDDRIDDEFRTRVRDFMLKAMREAKAHTSWSAIDEAYEAAVLAFCDALLGNEVFESRSRDLRRRVAACGALNSLSQLVLKLGAPGIPDFYQGTETWNLALVDPDNRRPVDYDMRRQRLAGGRAVGELVENWRDGDIKTAVLRAGLDLRNAMPELFRDGDLRPLSAAGSRGDHVVAFARSLRDQAVVFAAGRWFARLIDGTSLPQRSVWEGTTLKVPRPQGAWLNVLTGEVVRSQAAGNGSALSLAELFAQLPCAILVPER